MATKWYKTKTFRYGLAAAYGANTLFNYLQDNNERDDWYWRLAGAATTDHVQDIAGWFGREISVNERPGGSNLDIWNDEEALTVESAPPGEATMILSGVLLSPVD